MTKADLATVIQDAIDHAPEYVALAWGAITWGELAGIVVYLLGARIYAELLLEHRAQLHRLPRYMVRLCEDDLVQVILWPFMAAFMVCAHFVIRKENRENVRAFIEHQKSQAPRDRHPYMRDLPD